MSKEAFVRTVGHPTNPRSLRAAAKRMGYTDHSPYFWDCLEEHGANVALLWSWAVFACRVNKLSSPQIQALYEDRPVAHAKGVLKWPHFGYCEISDRKLGDMLGVPRETVRDWWPGILGTGWLHGWRVPRRYTVIALGVLPRVIPKEGTAPAYASPVSVPREAYGFGFGDERRGGGAGSIVRLCPMSGDWWSVDELGREGPRRGEGGVIDLAKVVRND